MTRKQYQKEFYERMNYVVRHFLYLRDGDSGADFRIEIIKDNEYSECGIYSHLMVYYDGPLLSHEFEIEPYDGEDFEMFSFNKINAINGVLNIEYQLKNKIEVDEVNEYWEGDHKFKTFSEYLFAVGGFKQ